MDGYLKMYSGEKFVPEKKDYDRAESCNSEAKALAQIKSITDLDKLFRRCIAFVTRGSYGTNAKVWMDRARELGAKADDIVHLYELILDARLTTPNPNENAPDNSSIISSIVNNDEMATPAHSSVGSHPTYDDSYKLKYFAKYGVLKSYSDYRYSKTNYWSDQATNAWGSESGSYVGNSVDEVISSIITKFKDVIYSANIIDDRLVIAGYGYGNFGGELMSSSYSVVADDIIRQSRKEYEMGDREIIKEVNNYLHAIKLSIPIWVGNPNTSVGLNYRDKFDIVTNLDAYKKLIPTNLMVDPMDKLIKDANSYDVLAAAKRIHGERK